MPSPAPRVILLGRSDKKTNIMQDFLKDIQASRIPYAFIDSVYVTLFEDNNKKEDSKEERYKIDRKYLKKGLDYSNIERSLEKLGISQLGADKNISLVEVIVDLDAAQEKIQSDACAILDPLFVED